MIHLKCEQPLVEGYQGLVQFAISVYFVEEKVAEKITENMNLKIERENH